MPSFTSLESNASESTPNRNALTERKPGFSLLLSLSPYNEPMVRQQGRVSFSKRLRPFRTQGPQAPEREMLRSCAGSKPIICKRAANAAKGWRQMSERPSRGRVCTSNESWQIRGREGPPGTRSRKPFQHRLMNAQVKHSMTNARLTAAPSNRRPQLHEDLLGQHGLPLHNVVQALLGG